MYDELSGEYDLFVNWPSRLAAEIDFLDKRLRATGGRRVLDAACGTGQHALALNNRGYQVTGADISGRMIERARDSAQANNADISFVQARFGELHERVGGDFDGLLCLGNSLPHVRSYEELRGALADFASCLRPGGVLIIQNRNFDQVLDKKQRWMDPQSHADDRGEWLFVRFYDFEADGTLTFNMLTIQRRPGEPWAQKATSTTLLPFRHDRLLQEMKLPAYDNVLSFGDLQGSEYIPGSSPNHVVVAQRA